MHTHHYSLATQIFYPRSQVTACPCMQEEVDRWQQRHDDHGALQQELVRLRAAHARLLPVAKRDAERVEKLRAAVVRLESTGVNTADREAALRVQVCAATRAATHHDGPSRIARRGIRRKCNTNA